MTSYPFALLSGLISSWLGALSTDCHIGSMLTSNTLLQNRYLIIRLLAQGGMGAVYEARDQRLNTTVALKETFFTDEAFRQAFHREASLLATLRHQALPKVIDHFAENDGQFLVMEFIRGDDLSRLLEIFGRPIPVRDVLAWADQLLGALEYLHAQRPPIIHRDIKPQNLKLNERGEIVLLDFGLAKEEALTTSQYNRSVRGYTLNYAPLEQIQGTGTEPRSDLYSAAATFYHLLTGVVPPDAVTRATALVESQPDPLRPAHELNPRVPVPVSDVLQQALAQDRNRRPANAAKLRAALRQAASALLAATPAETPGATAPIPPVPKTQEQRLAVATAQSDAPDLTMPRARTEHPPEVEFQFAQPPQKSRTRVWLAIVFGAVLLAVLAAVAFWPREQNPAGGIATGSPTPTPTPGNATPLAAREVLARGEQEERLYSFTALPGELKFTLNVIGAGSTITVELLDGNQQPLNLTGNRTSFSVASTGENEQGSARLLMDREQPVQVRVKTAYPQSLEAFRLRIEGPAKLPALDAANASPLAALFADRDRPLALPSHTLYGGQNSKKTTYYALTAGPGEINLTLNVIGAGSTVEVEPFDEDAQPLQFSDSATRFSVASTELNEQGQAQLVLVRQQKIVLRIHTSYPQSLRAYRLKLAGALPAAGNADAAQAEALAPLFAPRDTPDALTDNDINGRNPAKEAYYRLQAGPGALRLALEVEGNGATVTAELFDELAKPLLFNDNANRFAVSSTGAKEKKSAEVMLTREEPLVLRLSTSYPASLKEFRLKFEGAFKKP